MSRHIQNRGEERSSGAQHAAQKQSQSFSLKHLAQTRSTTAGTSAAAEKAQTKTKRPIGRPSQGKWEKQFELLKVEMATKYPNGGFVTTKGLQPALASFISTQRSHYRCKTLSNEKTKKLESLGFHWKEGPSGNQQEAPQRKKTSAKGTKGNSHQKKKPPPAQKKQPVATGKSRQSTADERWEFQFNRLTELMKTHYPHGGYLQRSEVISKVDGTLANWINRQRSLYREREQGNITPLTKDRIERLESIKFEWKKPPTQEVARAAPVVEDSNNAHGFRPNVVDMIEPNTSSEEDDYQSDDALSQDDTLTLQLPQFDDLDSHRERTSISDSEEESRVPLLSKKKRKSPTVARAAKRKRDNNSYSEESDSEESEDRKPAAKRNKRSHRTELEASTDSTRRLGDLMNGTLVNRLLSTQLDHVEDLKKENARLMEEVKDLRGELQDLKRSNRSLGESYEAERQRRKQAERQLKKLKR